jgi:hypothetical protein
MVSKPEAPITPDTQNQAVTVELPDPAQTIADAMRAADEAVRQALAASANASPPADFGGQALTDADAAMAAAMTAAGDASTAAAQAAEQAVAQAMAAADQAMAAAAAVLSGKPRG